MVHPKTSTQFNTRTILVKTRVLTLSLSFTPAFLRGSVGSQLGREHMMAATTVPFPDISCADTPYVGHFELLGGESYMAGVDIFGVYHCSYRKG